MAHRIVSVTLRCLTVFLRCCRALRRMSSQGKLLDLLWEVAPLAVALGAGVVTYYMTKDDEDYINNDAVGQQDYVDYQYNQPGYQDIHGLGSNQISSFPMKDYQGNEQLGAIVELLEKNAASTDPPRWAEQLFQVTNALSDEVKTIKEIVLTNSPQRAATTATTNKVNILTQEEMVTEIKLKFNECINNAVDKALLVNVPYNTLQSAVQSLHLYINNIVDNINVPRYRKISTTNNSYKSNVQPLEGHEKLFEVLGFTLNGSTYEWIPPYASAEPGNVMNETSWIGYFRHVLSVFSLVKSAKDYKSVMEALVSHFEDIPAVANVADANEGEGKVADAGKGEGKVVNGGNGEGKEESVAGNSDGST